MHVFFSVGEPSGDLHGANLITDLRQKQPGIQCVGYGGPKMAAAGCDLHEDLTQLAVMWFSQVLKNIHRFRALLRRAEDYFRRHRPDAVVLIDYPGFNWWIARIAKRYGVRVFYYGPPQMWAWAPWRIHKMRRLVDDVLCKLPFEARWYDERNCRAVYVGHPYFDEMERRRLDEDFLKTYRSYLENGRGDRPLVTILPGSRRQEVEKNLPFFLRAAQRIAREVPTARFAVASFNERQAVMARACIAKSYRNRFIPDNLEVFAERTPELIHLATSCMACSGSVSLELLHHQKPTVIYYHINRLVYTIGMRCLVNVKYITLVNLLADPDPFTRPKAPFDAQGPEAAAVPFPEYPTYQDKSSAMARHIIEWLSDDSARRRKIAQLAHLKEQYGASGASQRAAEYILAALGAGRVADGPHFFHRPDPDQSWEFSPSRESV